MARARRINELCALQKGALQSFLLGTGKIRSNRTNDYRCIGAHCHNYPVFTSRLDESDTSRMGAFASHFVGDYLRVQICVAAELCR